MVERWILYTILNIVSVSIGLIAAKWATDKLKMDSIAVALGGFLTATILFSPIFISSYISEPQIFPSQSALFYLLASIGLNAAAFIFFVKALKSGELSIVGPLENMRPVFVAALGIFFVGVALVAAGAFVVHLKNNLSETFSGIIKSKVSFYMLAMAFLYGLTANVDKLALASFSPTKYTFYIILGMTAIYSAVYAKSGKPFKNIFNNWSLILGIFYAIALWAVFAAVKLVSPTIFTPVQMLRTILMAFAGFALFGEKGIKLKIIGALIMLPEKTATTGVS